MYLLFKDGYFNYPSSPNNDTYNYRRMCHCNYGFSRVFDTPDNEIHMLVIKQRMDLYTSGFWCDFVTEFPSAFIYQAANNICLAIPDPFDCIKFKFMLVN